MYRLILIGIVVWVAASARELVAAPVTWGVPFELVSESDLDLAFGPVVYAQNAGDNIGNEAFIPLETLPTLPAQKSVTIGGQSISFEGIDAVYGDNASFGMIGFPFETFGDAVDHLSGQSFNVTFNVRNGRTVNIPQVVFDPTPATLFDPPEPADYSVATGNAELDSILDSVVFMDSRNSLGAGKTLEEAGALEIFLNNLTIGVEYQVQIIGGADDRRFASDAAIIDPAYMADTTGNGVSPIGTLSDGLGNTVPNIGAFLDLDEDDVGHVTTVLGTFVADSVTQQIDFLLQRGRNAGIAALVLTQRGASLAGDFNGDGSIDAADYTVWRDNLGTGYDLAGNGDESAGSEGVVNQADYDLWRNQFATRAIGATGAVPQGNPVPEPSAVVLSVVALLVTAGRWQRRPRNLA